MKECKDFGEVLVALGQGKTIIDRHSNIYRLRAGSKLLDYYDTVVGWCLDPLPIGDIVLPASIYEEPKTVEVDVWLNVYLEGADRGYDSRGRADNASSSDRLACINIKRTVTEGEGL